MVELEEEPSSGRRSRSDEALRPLTTVAGRQEYRSTANPPLEVVTIHNFI
jgi:hypothetical protein